MKAKIEEYNDQKYLRFTPKGLSEITIPVTTKGGRSRNNCWSWNGDLEKPTLEEIISHSYKKRHIIGNYGDVFITEEKIRFYLIDGVCKCLGNNSGEELQLKTLS